MLKKEILASILIAFALLQPAVPALAQSTGKGTVQELVTLFSAWSGQPGRHSIFDAAARHIDYSTMAELAFTPAQWDAFTASEKRDLTHSFQRLVESRYYMRWHKLFLRSRLTIANEARAGGDIYVKTYVTEGKDEDTVIWRLRPRNGEPMVISLDVNGKDLVGRLSDRFQKQLKKRGAQGLVAWLKNQASNQDDETADESSAVLRKAAAR